MNLGLDDYETMKLWKEGRLNYNARTIAKNRSVCDKIWSLKERIINKT